MIFLSPIVWSEGVTSHRFCHRVFSLISGDKIQQAKLRGCNNQRFIRVLFIQLWNYLENHLKREIWYKKKHALWGYFPAIHKRGLSIKSAECDIGASVPSWLPGLIATHVCTCLRRNISQTRSASPNLSSTYFHNFYAKHYGLHDVLRLPILRAEQASKIRALENFTKYSVGDNRGFSLKRATNRPSVHLLLGI